MKKILIVICCVIIFVGCGNDANSDNKSDESTTLQISNQSSKELEQVVFQSVLFIRQNADIIGTWTGQSLFEDVVFILNINDNSWSGLVDFYLSSGSWTRNGNTLVFQKDDRQYYATATIFDDILIVDLNFPRDMYYCTSENIQKSIKFGTSVTKQIAAGGGYIFFKVNSVDYYTNEFVVIESNEKAVFLFNNNTLVVEVNNPSEPIKLGDI